MRPVRFTLTPLSHALWWAAICVITITSCTDVTRPVEVAEPGTPDPLLLGIATATPSSVAPETPTPVIFRAQVDGTSTPPEVLFLDELDLAGEPLKRAVAELRDDGKGADTVARDQIYSGTFAIDRPASELRFRVRAAYFGKEVVSGATTFLVTPFPREARPSNPDLLVPVPGTPSRVFANEVQMRTIPGVSPDDVVEIAASIDGTVVGVIPPLRIYLIEFPGDRSANGVVEAIATVSTFSQVESAAPNFEMVYNTISFNSGMPCDPTNPTCPDDGTSQWYLATIGARQAWDRAGGGSSSAKVAVVDGGVDCGHTDLSGRCTGSGSNEHATQVAGIIAATANNGTGIAGVAWDTQLESITAGVGGGFAFESAMTTVSSDVKVVNISQKVLLPAADSTSTTQIGYLRDGVCHAVDAGKLVVVAGGNIVSESDEDILYPARLNNETSYACPSGRLMAEQLLVVGGSNSSDGRATWTESGVPIMSSDAPYLDIYAPGLNIHTITSTSSTAVATVSGTSFATAQVSGAAAVLWAHGAFVTPSGQTRAKAIHDRLVATGDPISICAMCKRLNLDAAVSVPYDIVFVLDRSGSMSSPSMPSDVTSPSRWDALKDAVDGFTPLISTSPPPDSRFGLTLFASSLLLPDPLSGLATWDSSSGLATVDTNLAMDVSTALPTTPGGSTAMGLGLQDGMQKMTVTSRPRVAVLFTDGLQNVYPKVADRTMTGLESGCDFTSDGSTIDSTLTFPTIPGCNTGSPDFKIIAVGIATPVGTYHDMLQDLATKNGGQLIITDNGADFSEECTGNISIAFDCAIAPALSGNSPQMVTSYKGTLSNAVTLPAFDLNKNVTQLLVKMSFSRKFEIPELSSILAGVRIMKDATDITRYFQPIFPSNYTNSVLLKTNFVYREGDETNTIAPEGSYTIQMTAPAHQSGDLGYWVVPYADDHRLDMDWRVSPLTPRVNHPFNPTVRVSWRGRPLTDANVEARILKPGDDLGDLLAKHPQTVDPVSTPDAGSPGYQKYLYLLQNDPNFLAQLRPKEGQLILAHQGDGQYSASYNPGDVSGIYQIVYRVTAESAEFGKIQRKALQSVYTRFGDIDLGESAVSSVVRGNTVTINLRPITTYGRFIGPAQGSAFSVNGPGISLSSITDHQDGRYTLVLESNPDARVSIKLLGEEIYQGPASEMGKTRWLVWLIIIVLILLLLTWMIWRVIAGTSGP